MGQSSRVGTNGKPISTPFFCSQYFPWKIKKQSEVANSSKDRKDYLVESLTLVLFLKILSTTNVDSFLKWNIRK